jgi:site-specific DNA-methyltransferase (adenine-specific)
MELQPFYEQSGMTIYRADCLQVMPRLPSCSIDFVLTDPPYLVDYIGRWDGEKKPIIGDDDAAWLYPAFAEVFRLMKPDTFCVSFYGWPHAELFVAAWKSIGFRLVSHLAFVKNVWGLGRFTRGQHETAYLLAKGRPPLPEKSISDVIHWQRETDAVHPNQKPVGALYPLFSAYAPRAGTVLDPFMGSGSTLRAAKDFALAGVGIEIEERWASYAAGRMAQESLFVRPRAGPGASARSLFSEEEDE